MEKKMKRCLLFLIVTFGINANPKPKLNNTKQNPIVNAINACNKGPCTLTQCKLTCRGPYAFNSTTNLCACFPNELQAKVCNSIL